MGSNGDLDRLLPYDVTYPHQLRGHILSTDISIRSSKDKATMNKHGSRFFNLCKATEMMIFNGRIGEDKGYGDFTRDDTTGRSVVDYVLGTPKLLDIVTTSYIMDKVHESDHRAIFFSLKCRSRAVSKQTENTSHWGAYHRYYWTHEDLNNLSKVMFDPISESFCTSFKNSIIDQSDPDTEARKLDQYILQVCKITFEQNK